VIKTINSQKVFNILWYLLLIITALGIINGTISIILFSLEISNVFLQNMNWTIIPLIFMILLFLLFFYPEFYKDRKNIKFQFIARFHSIKSEFCKNQMKKDILLGSFFISVEFFLSLFIIIAWLPLILDSILTQILFVLTLIVIISEIFIIGIIYHKRFINIFNLYVIYSSVLVGILFPMLFIGGIFIFFFLFYFIPWIFADPTILWIGNRSSWLNAYLLVPLNYDLLVVIEVIIFLFGSVFFIISLAQLVRRLGKKQGLVQTGIYKHIRHPQNLAIIIMVFPFALYVPGFFSDIGIRIGDLVSWVQFIFLIIIYSDIGDIRLKTKYPEEFQHYYENTGYMFPKLSLCNFTGRISVFRNKKARYGLFLFMYIMIISFHYLIYLIFPSTGWY